MIMRMRRFILLGIFGFLSGFVVAQSHGVGAIVAADYQKKLGAGFNFTAEMEFRFDQNFTNFNHFKLGTTFDYSFWKDHFKVGVFANYMLHHDEAYIENRGRIGGFITFSQKIRNFTLAYRVRFQSTFYDGKFVEHDFNPKTYMRNRLYLEYAFPKVPLKLYASTEFFLRLYEKNACFVDEFRTILGMNYRFNESNSIDVFLRMDNDIQVSNPENVYYIGVIYKFKH